MKPPETVSEPTRKPRKTGIVDFLYGSVLGEGAYARVLHVKHMASEKMFAAKILDKR